MNDNWKNQRAEASMLEHEMKMMDKSRKEYMEKHGNETLKFKIGDKAYKPKGYKFPCTIVSVFKNTNGDVRIVGEMDDNGMLHIFNENQLEHYETDIK